MHDKLEKDVAALLKEAGRAHHKAYEATDGDDPDWPIWYADYARDKFAECFGMELTRSQLVYCLIRADSEHQARAPDSDWAEFYASEFIARCAPSESPARDSLALYYYDGCPFCMRVLAVIDELDVNVELRNILQETRHRDDLIAARSRATVPVLRITSPDGEDRWMPESSDIVTYLRKTYG